MKKSIIAALSLTLFLSACGSDSAEETDEMNEPTEGISDEQAEDTEQTEETRTLTDGTGTEVDIPSDPERIIATYLEDYLVALDVTPVVQWSVNDGDSIQFYLEDELGDLPTIPYDLPYEAVLEHEPDLILIRDAVEEDQLNQYRQIAPTYVLNSSPTEWRDTLLELGEVLGEEEAANQAIDDYDARAEETAALVSEQADGESAAAVWLVNDALFVVHPERSSGAVLYGDAGFEIPEVVSQLSADADWAAISLEELAQMEVDHLFFINDDTDLSLSDDRLWQNIPAVQNDAVYTFDSQSAWLYYGPVANTQVLSFIEEAIHSAN